MSSPAMFVRLLRQALQSTSYGSRNLQYTVTHRAASSVTESSLTPRFDHRKPPESIKWSIFLFAYLETEETTP